jgi:hypothetical protein
MLQLAPPPKAPLGIYRILSPKAGIRVSFVSWWHVNRRRLVQRDGEHVEGPILQTS